MSVMASTETTSSEIHRTDASRFTGRSPTTIGLRAQATLAKNEPASNNSSDGH